MKGLNLKFFLKKKRLWKILAGGAVVVGLAGITAISAVACGSNKNQSSSTTNSQNSAQAIAAAIGTTAVPSGMSDVTVMQLIATPSDQTQLIQNFQAWVTNQEATNSTLKTALGSTSVSDLSLDFNPKQMQINSSTTLSSLGANQDSTPAVPSTKITSIGLHIEIVNDGSVVSTSTSFVIFNRFKSGSPAQEGEQAAVNSLVEALTAANQNGINLSLSSITINGKNTSLTTEQKGAINTAFQKFVASYLDDKMLKLEQVNTPDIKTSAAPASIVSGVQAMAKCYTIDFTTATYGTGQFSAKITYNPAEMGLVDTTPAAPSTPKTPNAPSAQTPPAVPDALSPVTSTGTLTFTGFGS